MAIKIKEVQNRDIDVDHTLTYLSVGEDPVDEFSRGKILELNVGDIDRFTPDELIEFGAWLIKHGNKARQEYDSLGNAV